MSTVQMDQNKINFTFNLFSQEESSREPANVFQNFNDAYTSLSNYNKEHEGFLDRALSNYDIGNSDSIASCYKDAGEIFSEIYSSLGTAATYSDVDSNGGVSAPGGSDSSGGGGSIDASSVPSQGMSGTPSTYTPSPTPADQKVKSVSPLKDYANSNSEFRISDGNSGSFTPTATTSSNSFTPKASSSLNIGSTGSSLVGGAASVGGLIGGLGSADTVASASPIEQISYPLGNTSISTDFFDSLPAEERTTITKKLREVGYDDEEVDQIMNGVIQTPRVFVDELSDKLKKTYEENDQLRNDIIDQYGIDVFNDDGSVNRDKLSVVLIMDDRSGKDNYSIINLLGSRYGVDIVDKKSLDQYSTDLENLLLTNYGIKDSIIKKYGFDVYNDDGSINRDRLTLAMLIDNNSDDFSLDIEMARAKENPISNNLNTNIRNLESPKFNAKVNVPIAALVAAGGAAAGIGIASHNKHKKQESEDEDLVENKSNVSKVKERETAVEWVDKLINDV